MNATILLVRLMVEVASEAEAEEERRRIVPRIEGCGAVTDAKIEQYWKIPEYWEIALYLRPAESAIDAYACVVNLANSGWTTGGSDDDPWAVWNASRGTILLTERVRWAEVQLVRGGGAILPSIDPPATRDEIAAALARLHEESTAYWEAFPTAEFFAPLRTAWSPADNVRHLTKSIRPVAQALRTPKVVLWLTFGIARRPSRSFEEMRRTYDGVLAGGGKAGRFAPSERPPPEDLEGWRREIMRQREEAAGALVANLQRWSERALDRARLPHPLMGKLTVREMLFFTLYHNLHHVEVVERRKAESARDPALT